MLNLWLLSSFENIGKQIRSIFWKEEPRHKKSVKKDLMADKRREPRLENDQAMEKASDDMDEEEDEGL